MGFWQTDLGLNLIPAPGSNCVTLGKSFHLSGHCGFNPKVVATGLPHTVAMGIH